MRHEFGTVLRIYRTELRRYLTRGSSANLKHALRLGRKALGLGLDTLDLALVHEQALVANVLSLPSKAARARTIKHAGKFFAEAILPMEKTHRSAIEANVRLGRLNKTLSRRTVDLAASNRKLKMEIARRKVVEQTLRNKKQDSIRLLNQSRRMQEQLRLLSRGILSAQEEERKKISRELHDVIGQVLTSINVRLAVLKTEATADTKGLTKNITSTQRLVERSVNIVRRFAHSLRPSVLDDLGLIPCLESFLTRFIQETGIRVSLSTFHDVEKLNSTKRTVLYRVVQEALTNVARHSQASRAEVIIERHANDVHMQIKDNGKSFDVERVLGSKRFRRLGLLGMRERVEMAGGSFSVESTPGTGTTIHAHIPFSNGPRERSRR